MTRKQAGEEVEISPLSYPLAWCDELEFVQGLRAQDTEGLGRIRQG